jgi:glutaredoxin-related protein
MWVANHFRNFFKTQMDTSLNKAQNKQEMLCEKYLTLVGICMSLRNLPKFIQLRSISKSRFNKINTNSKITPPNNLDMVTFEFFCPHEILCLPRHDYINQFGLSKQESCTSCCNYSQAKEDV